MGITQLRDATADVLLPFHSVLGQTEPHASHLQILGGILPPEKTEAQDFIVTKWSGCGHLHEAELSNSVSAMSKRFVSTANV